MKLLIKTIFLLALLLFVFSCSEDEDSGGQNTGGLEITIHSPNDNATFTKGDTIVLSFTVKDDVDITTIAWDTRGEFGTGSLPGSELLGTVTDYSGEFLIPAVADAGSYEIDLTATDEGFTNVLQKSVTINIQ